MIPAGQVVNNHENSQLEDPAEPPAIQMDSAICRVENLSHGLQQMIDRMNGGPTEKTTKEDSPKAVPSLSDILQKGPQRIHDAITEAEQKLHEISDILFRY